MYLSNKQISTLQELISAKLELAKVCEKVTTIFLNDLCLKYDCKMEGLENKFKTVESALGKAKRVIKETYIEKENQLLDIEELKNIVSGIKDYLRYTIVINKDEFVSVIKNIIYDLTDNLYSVLKLKNRFGQANYKDVISWWNKPKVFDFTFEIQFHTPESIAAKRASHAIYEVVREYKNEFDSISPEIVEKLNIASEKIFGSVPIPKDIDNIKDI